MNRARKTGGNYGFKVSSEIAALSRIARTGPHNVPQAVPRPVFEQIKASASEGAQGQTKQKKEQALNVREADKKALARIVTETPGITCRRLAERLLLSEKKTRTILGEFLEANPEIAARRAELATETKDARRADLFDATEMRKKIQDARERIIQEEHGPRQAPLTERVRDYIIENPSATVPVIMEEFRLSEKAATKLLGRIYKKEPHLRRKQRMKDAA